jgi:hypothetical protein
MSKKAPDTRGKLDNNRNSKPKKKKLTTLSQQDLKDNLKRANKEETPLKLKGEKKPSKGQLFKQAHGYSKTMKRNMRKAGVDTSQGYAIAVRKPRKLAERKVRQKKHADSVAYKRVNGKAKGKKGQPAAKKKSESK